MDDPFAGWQDGPNNPVLLEAEVHVWGWSLAGGVDDLAGVQALLSVDELRRMRAFRFAPDAERYARSRAGLRRVLARYLGGEPGAVRFVYGEHGKPALADIGVEFNLSHTQAIATVAISATGPVGIDVEELRPVSRMLGEPVFSARELNELNRLENEAYTRAFFNGWTRKEAICKAEGLGFHLPPQNFSVSLLPDQSARIYDAGGVLSRNWLLLDISPGGATAGCLAAAVAPSAVRRYRL